MAGALAEAGVGLEEITNRVSVVAKAMGECRPRDLGGASGRLRLTLGLTRRAFQALPQGLRERLLRELSGTGSVGPQAGFLFHH